MTHSARSCRWLGGIGTGKSAALRQLISDAITDGVRPLAYLPTATDVGLRTERVDLPDPDIARALGALELDGRLARNLSSGERQRVRLATALSRPGRLAALDEPCRHLDPEHVRALDELLLARTREGMRLAVCDVRGVLAPGPFEEEIGTPAEVSAVPSPCSRYAGESLAIDIKVPFLLSSTSRPNGMQRVELARGDLVVVRGRNGSGKTSLLEALARSARSAALRYGISRQEPEHQVFASTPQHELAELAALHDPAPWCHGRELLASLGLDSWVGRPTTRLPLGILALLGAVIALWMGHDLVLLDEPTQGLDCRTARLLASELLRCSLEGARVVVATHDPELMRIANRTWTVEAGALRTGDEA